MAKSSPALKAGVSGFLRSAFTEHLPYKGAALFLSIVLWLVVENQSPRSEEVLPVKLVLELDTTLVRTSTLPPVQVLVSGRQEQTLKLKAQQPEIRLRFAADAPDSMVVRLLPRDIILPEGVSGVRVRDVEPDSFVVTFDSLAQKLVPVRSRLRIVAGAGITIAGAERFTPDTVRVVGLRLNMLDLFSVATIDREMVVTDTLPVEVMLESLPRGVQAFPDRVQVRVPVVRQYWQ